VYKNIVKNIVKKYCKKYCKKILQKSIVKNTFWKTHKSLAPDGGLFLPKKLSQLNLDRLVDLDFTTRMVLILEDLLPKEYFPIETLERICSDAYKHFPTDGTPVIKFGENLAGAELFHGPSGSFKDYDAVF